MKRGYDNKPCELEAPPRTEGRKIGTIHSSFLHELVFAIPQRNLNNLASMVIERSTPSNKLYQKWMTFEEIGSMTSNIDAAEAVDRWLHRQGISVTKSRYSHYIKATANISTWEMLLHTKFFMWEYLQSQNEVFHHISSEGYSVPATLCSSISAIFHTSQPPTVLSNSLSRQRKYVGSQNELMSAFASDAVVDESQILSPNFVPVSDTAEKTRVSVEERILGTACNTDSGVVTVPFLNCLYGINSNVGKSVLWNLFYFVLW